MKRFLYPLILSVSFIFGGVQSVAQESALTGKNNDLKFTLLSIGSGSSRFTYERAIGEKNSAEITLGIVGWGADMMNKADPEGLLIKAAYKWNLIPMEKAQSALAGFYVKPELVIANFDYTHPISALKSDDGGSALNRYNVLRWALMAECGYQLLLNWFVFDIYTGLGPSFGDVALNNYYHSFMLYPAGSNLAFTAGFRLGVAF